MKRNVTIKPSDPFPFALQEQFRSLFVMYEDAKAVRFSGIPISQQLVCLLGLRCNQVEEVLFRDCTFTDNQVFINPLSLNILRLPFQHLNLFPKLKIVHYESEMAAMTTINLNDVQELQANHNPLYLILGYSQTLPKSFKPEEFTVPTSRIMRARSEKDKELDAWFSAWFGERKSHFVNGHLHAVLSNPYRECQEIGTRCYLLTNRGNRKFFALESYEQIKDLILQGHYLDMEKESGAESTTGKLGIFRNCFPFMLRIMKNQKIYKLFQKMEWSVLVPLQLAGVSASKLLNYTHLTIVYHGFCNVACGYTHFSKGMVIWNDLCHHLGEKTMKNFVKNIPTTPYHDHPIYRALRKSNVEMVTYLIKEMDCPIVGYDFRNSNLLYDMCKEFLTVKRRNIVLQKPKRPTVEAPKKEYIEFGGFLIRIRPVVNEEKELDWDYSFEMDYKDLPMIMSQEQIDEFNNQVDNLLDILERKSRSSKKLKF